MNNKLTKIKAIDCKNGIPIYLCKCNFCGSIVRIYASHFYRGSTSCKCKNLRKQFPRLYRTWANIKTRCNNDRNPGYCYYGQRGIAMCDEWSNSFENFKDWALSHGYNEELTIDRIDNDKGYSPDNCRWVTCDKQNRNKRNNIYYIYKNRKCCLREISRLIGINYKTMWTYYYRHGYATTALKYNLVEVCQ